jgi:hypothetical protein
MQALGNAILILPDKLPDRISSVVVPKSSTEMLPEWGTVVEAGPSSTEIKKGMRVIFGRKSASVQIIDGIEHYWVNENKIKYYE